MTAKTSQSIRNYLKTIYAITRVEERASTDTIAKHLDVTPASVTWMIQKLSREEPPLIYYEKHHGTALTPEGEQTALEIVKRHRLLETFLTEKLGYEFDEVHEEAERMEHFISKNLEDRIAGALDDVFLDLQGSSIQSGEFDLPVVQQHVCSPQVVQKKLKEAKHRKDPEC